MARELIDKPDINVGDRVWVNHPVPYAPVISSWDIYNEDDCHYFLSREAGGFEHFIKVRKDSVRLNPW